jgi:hypothetical protein
MKSSYIFAGFFSLCVSAVSANAAPIVKDLWVAGDGLLTVDTKTGYEWLDLSLTMNKSYNQITAGYGGYLASGFRYATKDEVADLVVDSGLQTTYYGQTASVGYQQAVELMALLGGSIKTPISTVLHGIVSDDLGGGINRAIYLGYYPQMVGQENQYWAQVGDWQARDSSYEDSGSFLVRPVPLPGALSYFGSALITSFAFIRSKRKK